MWKVGWAIIHVSDIKRAADFYENKVGIPIRHRSDEFPEFVELDTEGGATLALNQVEDKSDIGGQTGITLTVPDVQAVYEAASAKGVRFARGRRSGSPGVGSWHPSWTRTGTWWTSCRRWATNDVEALADRGWVCWMTGGSGFGCAQPSRS